ncbi:helix-turn-helix domain-containing protein [Sphingobium sp.]|uniref:helix-turn-helix domain-containing protein n=1 Tax=Sphingobium sp. TaxID=1912891 RepID=UPI002580FDE4|nr:helix-turn-helix domain-containing protein [Sphingobium sp.]MBR2270342.1 helix-turn-helix domain-containing protein [Sphingobium sp.]
MIVSVGSILCSIKDAASSLGVGRTLTYDLIKKGRLDTVKIGSRTLVKVDSIKALIDGATGGAV